MHRRTLLQSAALGSLSLTAGCIIQGESHALAATLDRLITRYPSRTSTQYMVHAERIDPDDQDPISLDQLSPRAQREVVNAIVRDRYETGQPLAFDQPMGTVDMDGDQFQIRAMIGDPAPPAALEAIPSAWTPEVTIEAEIRGGALTMTARNDEHSPLRIGHVGSPYFGAIASVGAPIQVLEHPDYESNEDIRTNRTVYTDGPIGDWDWTGLESGESLSETYVFSEAVTDRSIIWFTIPLKRAETTEDQLDRATLRVSIYLSPA